MLEHTFQTPLPALLEVSIPSGDVDVQTADGEETSLAVNGDERLLEQVEVRQDGGRVSVGVRDKSKFGISFSGGGFSIGSLVFGNGGLRVEARVPHGASVKVKTASADTQLAGQFGALELNSASGDLHLRGDVAERATVKTVSGDVELERVAGDLSVQSVSGDVRARSVAGSVDTKSVSGDIRVEAVTAGDVRFSSVSGDIEIGIASGSLLDVDAGSTSGDLSSEVPLATDPPVGEEVAAPTVVLRGRTVSGDLRVFRAA
jgi:putative adhesin